MTCACRPSRTMGYTTAAHSKQGGGGREGAVHHRLSRPSVSRLWKPRLARLGRLLILSAIVATTLFSSEPLGASADSGVCAIPGFDGPGGTLSGIVNTYYPGSTTVAAGSTSIPVGSPSGSATAIAAGDLLLVIQMQDAEIDSTNTGAYGDGSVGDPATGSTNLNNAGRYEYVVATGPVAAGSVPIVGDGSGGGLVYTYTDAAATLTQGQRRFQVIRVPQYSTATLSSTLTALQWDGAVGGVLAIDVAGQLTLGGTVSVSAQGFRGGGPRQVGGSAGFLNTDYRTPSTSNPNGAKAEGIAGTPILVYNGTSVVNTGVEGYPNGAMARGAPGNAGGGGTDGNPAANDQNSGGGGGGNGGAGGLGGFTWNTVLSRGGFGGDAFSVAAPDRVVLGGGGGAGTRNNTPGVAGASSGGVGGGMVMIRAGTLTGTGSIVANGGTGVVPLNDGGGGGGAGGSILLTAQTWSPTSLTVNAVGGAGANTWPLQLPGTVGEFTTGGANNRHGPGGGGGGGVGLLSSGVNVTTDVTGGANGTSTTAASAFGAQPGAAGVVSTTVTDGQVTTGISGILCLPVLTTTKTTSTPNVVNGPSGTSATYTISVSNAAGLGTAINLSISDALPSGFTYASTTIVNLSGGATRPSTTDPTVGDANPSWGTFQLPGGGEIEITFVVDIASSVPDGTYQNPATATYADPQRSTAGGTISSSYDPASSTGEDVTVVTAVPSLNVVKSESSTGPYGVGDPITYDIVVTNTGNVTLTNVTVSDPQATVGVCTPAQPGTLAPLASMSCPASYVVTQADVDAGSFTNTATADSAETGPDTDGETVTFTQSLSLSIGKTALPATYSTVGQVISYSFQVTNSGNVTLSGPFTVSDDQASDESCPATASLAPGASITCSASYTVTQGDLNAGSVTNIAAATNGTVTSPPDSETVTAVQVVDPAVTKSGDPATASIGDSIVFTLVITNNGNTVATNVRIVDVIPSFLTVTNVIAAPPATIDNSAGNTVDLLFATVAPTDVYTITITTIVNSSATPPGGSNIVTLTADDDDDPTNNIDSMTITIVVGGLEAPETGFAPGRMTDLPPQPADVAYTEYGELWLEIPSLDLETDIVGVPQAGGGWEVAWLGDQVGYLNGTAFPTWAGNSVITAHVTLPSGLAGPFADLKSLRFGDRVIIHGWGLRHIYEIREVDLVSPADRQIFRHEERSWLTLVTCHGYNEREASYRWRMVARAVLVSIETDGSLPASAILLDENSTAPARPPGLSGGG